MGRPGELKVTSGKSKVKESSKRIVERSGLQKKVMKL